MPAESADDEKPLRELTREFAYSESGWDGWVLIGGGFAYASGLVFGVVTLPLYAIGKIAQAVVRPFVRRPCQPPREGGG